MDYIAQPKDYWIALNAINITPNALGNPNRTQGSVASGAVILCYIEGVSGLGYDNGHRFRTWPLSISPTKFNSNTEKYVYVAIPRSASVGTQAVVVFPSEKLDIYGKNVGNAQIGSTDYYYIWLQGIITATDGTSNREWEQAIDFGRKGTDEDLYDDTSSDWYQYSKVSEVVTFLKPIIMKAGSYFQNLILGYKELTGVATSDTTYTDSDALVATPGYVESQYLSKTHESEAQEQIGFLKGLWIGVRNLYEITANGIAKLKSVITEDVTANRVTTDNIKSSNYTGEGVADTGFRLTNAYNGHSKLTIDEIYVRMKAVFESLEVRERTYTGGDQIWSCAGNRIVRVDYLGNVEDDDHVPQTMNVHADGRPEGQGKGDVYSVPVPGDTYGYSDVKVPWLLRQMPLLARAKVFARYRKVRIVINEPASSSANRAAASESPLANIRRARCYFLAKDDDMEVHNWWRINDLARCQTMNLANTTRQTYISGEDEKAGNIFWWRKVIGVSYEPVTLDDGKQYHYFDVAFDYEYEQTHPEVMATSVMEGSDIPAAQDSVVQFGNTIIEGRMNLMMMEVNGGDSIDYPNHTDAPCLKAYRGVYCFDLNKSWVGGRTGCCKMKLSPSTGYEFYGPNFKQVTEYDVVPVAVDRGLWTDICRKKNSSGEYINEWQFEKDDYGRTVEYSDDDVTGHTTGVRKCYYYDKVSHLGSYWLCSIVDGAHWVDGNGDYLSDDAYSALTEEQKALCSRKQNYTIEEPSANSTDWTEVVQKGDKGDKGEGVPEYTQTQEAWSNDGATDNAYTAPTTEHGRTDGTASHAAEADWHDTTPSNTENYTYLWRRSRKMVLKSDGTYEPEKNEQGTLTNDGRWSYARLSGTNGTSIRTKGTVVAVEAGSVTLPTTGVSSGDAGIKQGDAHLWKFNGTAWAQETATAADGDSYTVIKDCIVDLEQDGTSININGHLVMWSEEANGGNGAWVDLGEFKGEKGVNGKDGWMITANPANVIITQALGNDTTQFSTVKVGFTAKKGSAPATISDLAIPTGQQALSNEFNAAIGTGDDSKKVIVSSPKTYTPQGGTAQYYTEGTFVVDVIVTDPDTNSSVTFNVTVPCYANLLGTWKREVVGDAEKAAAAKVAYIYDPNNPDCVVKYETYGEYVRSSTENMSTLSGKVNGLENSVSQIRQTADEIKMSVNSGFRNFILNPKAVDAIKAVGQMEENNDVVMGRVMYVSNSGTGDFQLLCRFDDDNRTLLNNQKVVCYMVVKPLSSSGTICFGTWSATHHNSAMLRATFNGGVISVHSDDVSEATTGAVPVGNGWYICWSSFNAGEIFSEVKESNGINSVNGTEWDVYGYGILVGEGCPSLEAILTNTGLRSTGIDILDGNIIAKADNFKIQNSNGDNTFSVDADGNIVGSSSASFKGSIITEGKTGTGQGNTPTRWEITPLNNGIIGIPQITGFDTKGNPVLWLNFDGDLGDSFYVPGGGGMYFNNGGGNTIYASKYAREYWRVNCPNWGKVNATTDITRNTYMEAFPYEGGCRIFFNNKITEQGTDQGKALDFMVGVDNSGALLCSDDWPTSTTTTGRVYKDDWGYLKVKDTKTYDRINVKTSDFTLPDDPPIGTMFFVKRVLNDITIKTGNACVLNGSNNGTLWEPDPDRPEDTEYTWNDTHSMVLFYLGNIPNYGKCWTMIYSS